MDDINDLEAEWIRQHPDEHPTPRIVAAVAVRYYTNYVVHMWMECLYDVSFVLRALNYEHQQYGQLVPVIREDRITKFGKLTHSWGRRNYAMTLANLASTYAYLQATYVFVFENDQWTLYRHTGYTLTPIIPEAESLLIL